MKLLVTGSTGFLGSEVLPRLLSLGHTVYALSRETRYSGHKNLVYLQGSITSPISCPSVDAVVHMAALTSLREKDLSKMMYINRLGTENIAYFCLSHRIPLFYASTLFVSGDHSGTYSENDFDLGQGFKNAYERSKFETEKYLRAHPDLKTAIFRFGVLIGRYEDGVAQSFGAFYKALAAIVACHRFAEQKLSLPARDILEDALGLPRLALPIKITGDPKCPQAFTPVDFAASQFVSRINLGSLSKTYHIVPSQVPNNEDFAAAIRNAFKINGLEFRSTAVHTPISMMYNRLVKDFLPYGNNQPIFTTSLNSTLKVDQAYLERVINYWRQYESVQFAGINECERNSRTAPI
jgi:nucleoside-diphosphate-sugar epimerase